MIIKRYTVGVAMLISSLALGARDCLWDSWAAKKAQQTTTTSGGGGSVIKCLPNDCDLVCDGTNAYPAIGSTCPYGALNENFMADSTLVQWFLTETGKVCPTLDPTKDLPVHIKPPLNLQCNSAQCPTAPDKLPKSCVAVCSVSGVTPDIQGCPDPATNVAMAQFLMDLTGIVCAPFADTDPYTLTPDPSLVDGSICL